MILRELLSDYPSLKITGDSDIIVSGVNHDSRKVRKNDLFVAVNGFNSNGHKYISAAIENGAVCIIIENDIEPLPGITYVLVEDTSDALSYICSRFYNDPSHDLFMRGITGTNGKTSTSYFIKNILNANNINTGIIGTIGGIIDEDLIKLENTTPDSLVINHNLRKMLDSNINNCVMEVSSHALDLKRVSHIKYDIAIFTNLTKDHLDYHKTMENYYLSKLKLFYQSTKCNIINVDDIYGNRIINDVGSRVELVTYGINNKADVFATDISYSIDKVNFKLNRYDEGLYVTLNIPGIFSVYNSLAAAACCIAMGIDLNTIKIGLENITGIKGRFEVLPINKDFTVIIDFAHTSDGLEKVLTVIDQFAEGRKIIVFGAGGNRDKTKRPEMGLTVGLHSDLAIVTSDNPRFENPIKIIDDIIEGIKQTKVEYRVIVDRKEAIEFALRNAMPKDIVLLAGKGHETYTIIGENTYPFDERQIVLNYLKEL